MVAQVLLVTVQQHVPYRRLLACCGGGGEVVLWWWNGAVVVEWWNGSGVVKRSDINWRALVIVKQPSTK